MRIFSTADNQHFQERRHQALDLDSKPPPPCLSVPTLYVPYPSSHAAAAGQVTVDVRCNISTVPTLYPTATGIVRVDHFGATLTEFPSLSLKPD